MKPSDPMQSSGSSEVHEVVVDLLLQGPSSFAALYGFVVRMSGQRPSVDDLLGMLKKMEHEGRVRIVKLTEDGSPETVSDLEYRRAQGAYSDWLDGLSRSQLSVDALAVDDVGLWYALTQTGRHASGAGSTAPWTLDVSEENQSIRVQAKTADQAEEALENWLAHDTTMEVFPSTRVVSQKVDNHVELTWQFTRKGSQESNH